MKRIVYQTNKKFRQFFSKEYFTHDCNCTETEHQRTYYLFGDDIVSECLLHRQDMPEHNETV